LKLKKCVYKTIKWEKITSDKALIKQRNYQTNLMKNSHHMVDKTIQLRMIILDNPSVDELIKDHVRRTLWKTQGRCTCSKAWDAHSRLQRLDNARIVNGLDEPMCQGSVHINLLIIWMIYDTTHSFINLILYSWIIFFK